MQPDLKIGLVGAGWAAGQHSASISSIGGARVVSVYDQDPSAGKALAETLGATVAKSLEAVLASDIDAVVVSTPSGVHFDSVIPALELGKAVFVEKPLSRSSSDAWAIVEAAERTGTVCAVGYQWRALDYLAPLDMDLQRAQPALLISQGVGITQARPWFTDDRLSGGLIFERVSHHIDLQRMIAGDVAAVSASRGKVALSGRPDPSETADDVLTLTLRFGSGAQGLIAVGWAPAGYPSTQSLTLHTTGTTFDISLDPDFTLTDRVGANVTHHSQEHPFARQMRSFLHAVRARDQSLVHCSARDAAGTVETALAAAASLSENGLQKAVQTFG